MTDLPPLQYLFHGPENFVPVQRLYEILISRSRFARFNERILMGIWHRRCRSRSTAAEADQNLDWT